LLNSSFLFSAQKIRSQTVNKCVDINVRVRYGKAVPTNDRLDVLFDALANQSRREVVRRLRNGPMTTPQIGKHFGFTKQALNRHVLILRNARLVSVKTRGRVQELSLNLEPLNRLTAWMAELQRGWSASLDRLDEVLHESKF
jgi:DNA-binding transcriptional ArsR family regulator